MAASFYLDKTDNCPVRGNNINFTQPRPVIAANAAVALFKRNSSALSSPSLPRQIFVFDTAETHPVYAAPAELFNGQAVFFRRVALMLDKPPGRKHRIIDAHDPVSGNFCDYGCGSYTAVFAVAFYNTGMAKTNGKPHRPVYKDMDILGPHSRQPLHQAAYCLFHGAPCGYKDVKPVYDCFIDDSDTIIGILNKLKVCGVA